jgi:hypothetical protein
VLLPFDSAVMPCPFDVPCFARRSSFSRPAYGSSEVDPAFVCVVWTAVWTGHCWQPPGLLLTPVKTCAGNLISRC